MRFFRFLRSLRPRRYEPRLRPAKEIAIEARRAEREGYPPPRIPDPHRHLPRM
jgi:hypothetical protein